MTSLKDRDWFQRRDLVTVMALLNRDGGQARIVGGVVRNALMGIPVSDFDIATTVLPEEVMKRAEKAGIKAVPTGLKHGTVTLVVEHVPFEVTTLRKDVETDGRHAEVAFTDDWDADARRRDFTINALYCDAEGTVHDPVGGLADVERRNVRFIGEADDRIAEDHLRILRFFRFFAWYGGGRPDASGLKACARARDKLSTLSAERVWAEMTKIMSAPDPARALLWMRTSGVLANVLPETEKWGIDAIHGLVAAETAFGWPAEALIRLAAIVPPVAERMANLSQRLRLSRAEAAWLQAFAETVPVAAELAAHALAERLYREGTDGIIARLKLDIAAEKARDGESLDSLKRIHGLSHALATALSWKRPVFPVKGSDLASLGVAPGPEMGARLKSLEADWVASGFTLSRADLLKS